MSTNRAGDIRIDNITDVHTREAIRLLKDTAKGDDLTSIAWKSLELDITAPVTKVAVKNPSEGIPSDIIITKQEWTGTVGNFSWDYSLFTKDSLYYTSTEPVKIRALVGKGS